MAHLRSGPARHRLTPNHMARLRERAEFHAGCVKDHHFECDHCSWQWTFTNKALAPVTVPCPRCDHPGMRVDNVVEFHVPQEILPC